jgi:hypothetical protein
MPGVRAARSSRPWWGRADGHGYRPAGAAAAVVPGLNGGVVDSGIKVQIGIQSCAIHLVHHHARCGENFHPSYAAGACSYGAGRVIYGGSDGAVIGR